MIRSDRLRRLRIGRALRGLWLAALLAVGVACFLAGGQALGQTVSFGPAQKIASFTYGGIAAADMDGKGYVDILYSGYRGRNNGATTPAFTAVPTQAYGNMKVANIIRPGSKDIVSFDKGVLAWSENKSNPPSYTRHPIRQNDWLSSYCVADLNGDCIDDIVTANATYFNVNWIENSGGKNPVFTEHAITTCTAQCSFMTTGDLDSDGDNDIIIAFWDYHNPPNYQTNWLENNGANPPQFTTHILARNVSGALSVADFNQDGHPDVLAGADWCENSGAKPPNFTIHSQSEGSWIYSATGDFNGDGWMDFAAVLEFTPTDMQDIYWFENDRKPTPSFTRHLLGQAAYSIQPRSEKFMADIVVTDIDRDGDVDPVVIHVNDGAIYFPNLRLSPKNVSVFEPHGGEQFYSGSDVRVSWRTDVAVAGTRVRLELWRGSAGCVAVLAVHDTAANGVGDHLVRLPNVLPGSDYRVRAVSEKDGTLYGESAGALTIMRANGIGGGTWEGYR